MALQLSISGSGFTCHEVYFRNGNFQGRIRSAATHIAYPTKCLQSAWVISAPHELQYWPQLVTSLSSSETSYDWHAWPAPSVLANGARGRSKQLSLIWRLQQLVATVQSAGERIHKHSTVDLPAPDAWLETVHPLLLQHHRVITSPQRRPNRNSLAQFTPQNLRSHLATLCNNHILLRPITRSRPDIFNLLNHIQTLNNLPKNHMFPIQMRCRHSRDKELTTIRIRPRILPTKKKSVSQSVNQHSFIFHPFPFPSPTLPSHFKKEKKKQKTYRHTQNPLPIMLQLKILIGKIRRAVNTRTARAIAVQKVSALEHEVFDHAVELRALVAQRLSQVVFGLARAELAEVFRGSGRGVGEEFDFDASEGFAAEGDVEEDDGVGGGCGHGLVWLGGLVWEGWWRLCGWRLCWYGAGWDVRCCDQMCGFACESRVGETGHS